MVLLCAARSKSQDLSSPINRLAKTNSKGTIHVFTQKNACTAPAKQGCQLRKKTSDTIYLSFLILLAICPILAPHVWRFGGLSVSEADTRTSPIEVADVIPLGWARSLLTASRTLH